MEENLALQGPDLLKGDLIVSAVVPRVYEARKGTAMRVRTIPSPTSVEQGLYSFVSHTFTPAGATGRFGPTLAQCRSAYSSASWTQNTGFFNMLTQGYQLWTVPQTGSYRIDARGANGGTSPGGAGGGGARMVGLFSLTKGQKLRIVVGQSGANNTSFNGGGGGASFVMKETGSTTSDILVIAGGGGAGGNVNNAVNRGATIADPSQPGWNGNSNTSLNNGRSGGNGGLMFDTNGSGGGGGGLLGDGQTSINSGIDAAGKGGQSFVNGAVGGYAFQSFSMEGGFGGGGSGDWYYYTGSGGGGGYSGGSGGYSSGSGGGGSSYNNGTGQSNTANQNFATGLVLIQLEDPPIVSTQAVSAITGTGATGNGTVVNNKGIVISTRGIVWDTNPDPTTILTTKSEESGSFGNGAFSRPITGLYGGTLYYVRAYAVNIGGVEGYGSTVSFTTDLSSPFLTTNSGTSVLSGSATITANIVATGGAPVTTRGVCWDTSPNPTISLSTKTVENGSFGTGSFTATTSGMVDNTTYYVRAYATNTVGTSYGTDITVTSNPYVITAGIKAPVGSSGMTLLQNGSEDDSFSFNQPGISTPRTMQFSIPFYGISRNQPFFGSNTYITFGSGSTQYASLSLTTPTPALPAIHLGTADNSWQRCYEFSTTNQYRFRYEGTASTGGTVGSPNIVYECTFFKQYSPTSDIYIEIVFGIHNRFNGNWGMTNGSTSSNVFTIFGNLTAGTGLVGTSGALQANRSYVLVLTSTGQFKNLYSGYYITSSVT
jgi:hypothetical protein